MNNTDNIMLSVLIPSIPRRAAQMQSLVWALNVQATECFEKYPMLGGVEILSDYTAAYLDGGMSIGAKRASLVNRASGKYLCFLDDDDMPAPNYIESLLRLAQFDADVLTFRAAARLRDYWALVDMRLAYKVNDQLTPEHTVRRPPWHICPVRREFAVLCEFPDKNNAEDFDWMERVLAYCTTEKHTEKILFQYNHGEGSEADKIQATFTNPNLGQPIL